MKNTIAGLRHPFLTRASFPDMFLWHDPPARQELDEETGTHADDDCYWMSGPIG